MGVVGKDTIMEYGGSFFEVADLGFGKCRFALAVKKGSNFYEGYSVKTVATKYPGVARSFFAEKGMDVEIIKIEGSVELAPLLGLSDGIVDIENLISLSARLIVNSASLKLRKKELEVIISAIQNAVKEN